PLRRLGRFLWQWRSLPDLYRGRRPHVAVRHRLRHLVAHRLGPAGHRAQLARRDPADAPAWRPLRRRAVPSQTHMSREMLAHADAVPEECAHDGLAITL